VTQQPPEPGPSGQQSSGGQQGQPSDGQQDSTAGAHQDGQAAQPRRQDQAAGPGQQRQPAGPRPQDRTGQDNAAGPRQQDKANGQRQQDRPNGQRQDKTAGQRQQFDPVGDMQRWLIRSGARNMRREIKDEVRRRIGSDRAGQGDVWSVAVSEPPPDAVEAPECAWCPVCRAARMIRQRPGFGAQLSGAGEAVAAAVQEALGAFDSVLARGGPDPQAGRSRSRDDQAGHAGEPDHEPDDRG